MNVQLDIARANDDYRREVLTRSYGRWTGHRTGHHRQFRLPEFLRPRVSR